MGKKRLSGSERRVQLMRVGRGVFATRGYETGSLDEVSKKAGVTKPIVYEHFGSKEGLFAAIVENEMDALVARMTEAISHGSARDRFENAVHAFLSYAKDEPAGFAVLSREAPAGSGRLGLTRVIDDLAARVSDVFLEEFARAGYSKKVAPIYANALVGMVTQVGQWWAAHGRRFSVHQVTQHVAALGWMGLRHLPKKPAQSLHGKSKANPVHKRNDLGREGAPAILAVDDVPANLVALDALLERDYEVIRAGSGAVAIQLLKAGPPVDVILMDVQMPVMDGYETAAAIKKLPGCEDVPLIFVTAVFSEDPHVKRGYAAGGIDYFAKPFDPDVLRMKIAVYASFRRRNLALLERERQVEASEELLQSARRLAALLEGLRVGVIISDSAGHLFQVNEEALRLFKATAGFEADAYGAIVGWWNEGGRLGEAVRAGNAVHNIALQVRCVDGTTRTLGASTSPLRGAGGVLAGGVVVLQDLSEHKKVGAQLEHQIARLVSLGAEVQRAAPA